MKVNDTQKKLGLDQAVGRQCATSPSTLSLPCLSVSCTLLARPDDIKSKLIGVVIAQSLGTSFLNSIRRLRSYTLVFIYVVAVCLLSGGSHMVPKSSSSGVDPKKGVAGYSAQKGASGSGTRAGADCGDRAVPLAEASYRCVPASSTGRPGFGRERRVGDGVFA